MKRLITVCLYIVAVMVVTGCKHTYRDTFMLDASKEGWTREQQLAAYHYSFRLSFLKKLEEEGKTHYVTNYAKLPTEEARKKLDELLESIDQTLSYRNREAARFVDTFGLRAELEHEEEIRKLQRARVRAVELYDRFQKLIGNESHHHDHDGDNSEEEVPDSAWDFKRIFVKDPQEAFKFQLGPLERARESNILKAMEEARRFEKRLFDRKEPDPSKLHDANAFVWKSKTIEFEVVGYKILQGEQPLDNHADYVEGYRVVNGKRESQPALKAFFVNGHGVMVLDTDREGETGFGFPDFVEPMWHRQSAQEFADNNSLMDALFADKKALRREAPQHKPLFVEIAPVGDPIDLWEQTNNPLGWVVPYPYKNEKHDNYNVKVVFDGAPKIKDGLAIRTIKYYKLEWYGPDRYTASLGRVVECFRPKAPYDTVVDATVLSDENTKKLVITLKDGTEERGMILPRGKGLAMKLMEDQPACVEYDIGQTRYQMHRESGKSIFKKRKKIDPKTDLNIGQY